MDIQNLPYRLKSARRKKRLQKEDRDKQLLKLHREQERIANNPDYLTVVPLDEPYQKGWKRLFVLKPDVKKSDKADFYQGILDAINDVQYHYDRLFKKPKRKRWQRFNYEVMPYLKSISRYDWDNNKPQLNEQQRSCFERVEFWNDQLYAMDYRYQFIDPGLFQLAILPHIIYTIKIGDAALEQQLAWINNHMTNHNLYLRLSKLTHGRRYKYWKAESEKLKYANPLKNKQYWVILED